MDAAKIAAWAGAASAVLGVVVTVRTQILDDKADDLSRQTQALSADVAAASAAADLAAKRSDLLIKENQDRRSEDQFILDYNKSVYSEVLKLVEGGELPCSKQRAINAFIGSLRDSPFKIGMADAVKEAAGNKCADVVSTARDISAATSFDLVQRATEQTAVVKAEQRILPSATQPSAQEGWDYDVFWCEGGAEARAAAEKLAAALNVADPRHGRIRVRPLPRTVNERSGYGVRGYEIRAEAREQDQARRIKPALDAALGADLVIQTSGQSTPWYISIFACPTAS